MADWTAITGIVVSGVLGPGLGAWYAERRLGREHRLERVLADRAEVRSALDQASRDLRYAGRLRSGVDRFFLSYGNQTVARASEHIQHFREAVRQVDANHARLLLLLAPDAPIVSAHEEAYEALAETSAAVTHAAALGADALVSETGGRLEKSASTFEAAHASFIINANRIAAAELARPA